VPAATSCEAGPRVDAILQHLDGNLQDLLIADTVSPGAGSMALVSRSAGYVPTLGQRPSHFAASGSVLPRHVHTS
jgi:hypothetical protein